MGKNKKNTGFQSAAGLVRYFEEEKTGVKIDPVWVIVMGVATAVIVTALHILYPA
ncbi:MAG: preprotein translocase subunit Sec61beta [Thermoplasmata archaeon]|nr:MAG: preprotein translocase subunit Sec61beta [Thermoplasmata archaeon]HDH81915.1 preprotein translocase subunit Sec61beta [Thermoplasmatales archaeon]MCD6147660.1 preprotein translocase subunit Sec61beta [Thermoplasmata archaeon]RLF46419.1 MAG: preprotein translocase subunit Sec61beta [Thermoplasmata archaeon]RLF63437.1 MAG: preprotein translocase subunit Sec61beta [Thermoplasmata archaeon]